jgi:hypothetical protein
VAAAPVQAFALSGLDARRIGNVARPYPDLDRTNVRQAPIGAFRTTGLRTGSQSIPTARYRKQARPPPLARHGVRANRLK